MMTTFLLLRLVGDEHVELGRKMGFVSPGADIRVAILTKTRTSVASQV